jgi:hypothetical protein
MMGSSTGTVHKSLHVPDWEKVSSSLKMVLECGTPSATKSGKTEDRGNN